MKKFIQIFNNIILCLKYPFLYPRNRFTDMHYTNNVIDKKIHSLSRKYILHMYPTILSYENFIDCSKSNDKFELTNKIQFSGRDVFIEFDGENILFTIQHNSFIRKQLFPIKKYLHGTPFKSNNIDRVVFNYQHYISVMKEKVQNINVAFVLKEGIEAKKWYPIFSVFKLSLKRTIPLIIKELRGINSLLGWFHIVPTYTELDAMDYGWRKCFGVKICKEIRNSLLLTYITNDTPTTVWGRIKAYYKGVRHLFSYRIMQIKEKFGGLRWYAYGDTEDTLRIKRKYEAISEHTCIVCGKDATYRSTGWVCPFCDEHKPDNSIKIN